MTNTIRKKTLSVLLSIVMLLSVLGCLAVSVSAESSVAGIWNGSTTAANGTVYSLSLAIASANAKKNFDMVHNNMRRGPFKKGTTRETDTS